MSDDDVYYIAGPMSGHPQFNVPEFDALAAQLRSLGYTVVSPAELDSKEQREFLLASPDGLTPYPNSETWADFLARDVKLIADRIDKIVVLDGWCKSRGARLEVFVGLLTGKPIFHFDKHLWKIEPEEALYAIQVGFMREWANAKSIN